MSDISNGNIQIPQFQRDFVWSIEKSADLLDSIVKGYPIGTFILWKTKERLRSVRNIGNLDLPPPDKNDYVQYVLDGQQRITSIFATYSGETIEHSDGKKVNYSNVFVDSEAKEDEKIVTTVIDGKDPKQIIKLSVLLDENLSWIKDYDDKHRDKLLEYRQRITSYNYSTIYVSDTPIEVATVIFTRINEGGKPLTQFQIMAAKTYDEERNFDMAEKFEKLIEKLESIYYEKIPDMTILQIISLIIKAECKGGTILSLEREEIIDRWDDTTDSVERAIEYFRNYYRIPVYNLLPHNSLLVLFAYFFYYHKDKPFGDKQKYLEDLFWRISLSDRYSASTESKLAQDVKRIDLILKDELPKYDWPIDGSVKHIVKNGSFSVSRGYIKAILCIYAYQQPKSFADNSLVNINNNWLKRANSKNYHHFFPKAFLSKLKVEEEKINHVLNITIVDDFLNKRKIGDKAPSKYMSEFKNDNDNLSESIKTHLIYDLDEFGVLSDDYHRFLNKRAAAVRDEIKKRIIPDKNWTCD